MPLIMICNSLYWVETKNQEEHDYEKLYATYSPPISSKSEKDVWVLKDDATGKQFHYLTQFFMRYISRKHIFDSKTSPSDLPIVWSADQMALKKAYNQFRAEVRRQVRALRTPLFGENLIALAEKHFGSGKPVDIPKITLPTR